jgi:hypothetical protein
MNIAMIGIAILVISILGSMLLIKRSASAQQQQTKIMLFVLYFWLLTFFQLIAAAIGYSVLDK